MGFVWVHADSFLHCVASPFHSFVTTMLLPNSQRIALKPIHLASDTPHISRCGDPAMCRPLPAPTPQPPSLALCSSVLPPFPCFLPPLPPSSLGSLAGVHGPPPALLAPLPPPLPSHPAFWRPRCPPCTGGGMPCSFAFCTMQAFWLCSA